MPAFHFRHHNVNRFSDTITTLSLHSPIYQAQIAMLIADSIFLEIHMNQSALTQRTQPPLTILLAHTGKTQNSNRPPLPGILVLQAFL